MRETSSIRGFMLGTLAGDTIGLPYERLSRRRVQALVGGSPLRQRLFFGHGIVSDDTEHAVMTLMAWRQSRGDAEVFAKRLSWYLRVWMACVPPGCGLATAKACVRLLVGFSPARSGVRSAGNGPAMRAGVLGLLCESREELRNFVRVASRITHTDQRAEDGAFAIALAAMIASEPATNSPLIERFNAVVTTDLPDGEMKTALLQAIDSVASGEPSEQFAASVSGPAGVSGFIMHTVPVVIHIWLSEPSSVKCGIERAVLLGGDTDTVAALVGGLLGTQQPAQLPGHWLARVRDFPVSLSFIECLCGETAEGRSVRRWRLLVLPVRNVFFFIVVLLHAARRLLPPYAAAGS